MTFFLHEAAKPAFGFYGREARASEAPAGAEPAFERFTGQLIHSETLRDFMDFFLSTVLRGGHQRGVGNHEIGFANANAALRRRPAFSAASLFAAVMVRGPTPSEK
jgi:hypothetical protein